MRKKNIIILTLTIIVTLLFSGCFLQKVLQKVLQNETADEPRSEPFSSEKATEAALAYVNNKYGDEFIEVSHDSRGYAFIGGTSWYVSKIVRKNQKDDQDARYYEVNVSMNGDYSILGDTVMCEYYDALYYDYVDPIIKKEMGDIPYVLIVASDQNRTNQYFSGGFGAGTGVIADAVIPNSIDDENCIFSKSDFFFRIFISEKYDDQKNINTICENLKAQLTDSSGLLFGRACIKILKSNEYEELASSKNKYTKCRNNQFYVEKNFYIIGD